MAATSVNIHISDDDYFEFRLRTLPSCRTVNLVVGEVDVTFFISNQEQYDKIVDSLQSLVQELAPGRSPLTQEEAAYAGDAESCDLSTLDAEHDAIDEALRDR